MIRVEKCFNVPHKELSGFCVTRVTKMSRANIRKKRIQDKHPRSNIIVLLFFRYFTVISIATSSHSSWTSYLGTKFPLGQALSCWACHLLPLTSTICISWVYVVALECTLSSSGYSMLSLG